MRNMQSIDDLFKPLRPDELADVEILRPEDIYAALMQGYEERERCQDAFTPSYGPRPNIFYR